MGTPSTTTRRPVLVSDANLDGPAAASWPRAARRDGAIVERCRVPHDRQNVADADSRADTSFPVDDIGSPHDLAERPAR